MPEVDWLLMLGRTDAELLSVLKIISDGRRTGRCGQSVEDGKRLKRAKFGKSREKKSGMMGKQSGKRKAV